MSTTVQIRPAVDWKFILCDIHGTNLSEITRIATSKHMEFVLNRPAMVSFSVPSDSFLVNNTYIDPLGEAAWSSGTTYTVPVQRGFFTTIAPYLNDGTSLPYNPATPTIPVVTRSGRRYYAVQTSTNKDPVSFSDTTSPSVSVANIYWNEITPEPYLTAASRTLKCYRRESGSWVLRFFGYVWNVQDQSEDDAMIRTSATCYDASKILEHRIACNSDGSYHKRVNFPHEQWGLIARDMVVRTNEFFGETGIETSTGASYATTPTPTLALPWTQQYIGDAIYGMSGAGLFDTSFTPVDTISNKMVVMHILTNRSYKDVRDASANTPAIFGLDKTPHNILTYSRSVDSEQLANHLTLYADSGPARAHAQSLFSRLRYRTHQAVDTWGVPRTLEGAEFLQTTADVELNFRAQPKSMVYVTPSPEFSAVPWNDYFLGDGINVYSSANAREAIAGLQRIYTITLDINDDGYEAVTELGVAPQ